MIVLLVSENDQNRLLFSEHGLCLSLEGPEKYYPHRRVT